MFSLTFVCPKGVGISGRVSILEGVVTSGPRSLLGDGGLSWCHVSSWVLGMPGPRFFPGSGNVQWGMICPGVGKFRAECPPPVTDI